MRPQKVVSAQLSDRVWQHIEPLSARSSPEQQRNRPKNDGYREHGRGKPQRQANEPKVNVRSATDSMVGFPFKCLSGQIRGSRNHVTFMEKVRLHFGIRRSNVARVVEFPVSREPIGEQFSALDFDSPAMPYASGFVFPSGPTDRLLSMD